MKILMVNKFHYLKGGSEKYYFELAELLRKNGHEVAFFSMQNEKNIKTDSKEYFVESIDLNNGSKLSALDVIYSKKNKQKMKEALEDFKPDIVHLNNFQRQLSASIIEPIKEKNIPIVFTAHDMNSICPSSDMLHKGNICEDCIQKGYLKCIQKSCIKNSKLKSILAVLEHEYYDKKQIYKKIDCIIAPSEFIKKQFIKGKLKYKKIEVLHNFVIPKDENRNYSDNGYAFFFGRLSIEKGIMNLIKAIKNINSANLLIAGDGPEKENIKKYIKQNNLEDRVKLLGYLNQEQIKKYIKEARFIAVPSIWYENCPYSILETMEIGKPIVASKIGGIPELVENEKSGFLYKYNDIDELKEKMLKLFENEQLAKEQSRKAKEIFKQKYTDEIYYKKLIKIYEKLIEEKKSV